MILLGGAAFGLLYLVTPSVHNAPALARAMDRAHHVRYPGPRVPTLFAASLVATEDHRFYSSLASTCSRWPGWPPPPSPATAPSRAAQRSTSNWPRCSTHPAAAGWPPRPSR